MFVDFKMEIEQRKTGLNNFHIYKGAQHANEFIVTVHGAYHWGFNSSYNIAEATNYTNKYWITQIPSIKVVKNFLIYNNKLI